MSKERNLAAHLSRRRNLAPPVDIEALVREYADLEYDNIPNGVDAVLLGADFRGGTRPLIVVDAGRPKTRQRFTLAHELGHILIPWHAGVIAYHTLRQGWESEQAVDAMEAGAHRFASELLVPSAWIERLVASGKPLDEIFQVLRTAEVSDEALMRSLKGHLPTGFVITLITNERQFVRSYVSKGTKVKPTDIGSFRQYNAASIARGESAGEINTFYWWRFEPNQTALVVDKRKSQEVMKQILSRLGLPEEDAAKLGRSINGATAAAFGRNPSTDHQRLHTILYDRLTTDVALTAFCRDSDFETYLEKRVFELKLKKRK